MHELIKIKLNSIKDIYGFNNMVSKYDGDICVLSGKYCINGKSIIGLFSLNLLEPILIDFSEGVPEEVRVWEVS